MFAYAGVVMRPIEEGDLEFCRNLRNDPSTWPTLGSVEHVTEKMQGAWFERLQTDKTRAYFLVLKEFSEYWDKPEMRPVGIVRMDEIDRINRSIRVGADVVPSLRGHGIGTSVYHAILPTSTTERVV